MTLFDWAFMVGKVLLAVVIMVNITPVMVWVERRGSALMQNRLGPNRLGPLGFFHLLADSVKMISKEQSVPAVAERFYYTVAPIISLIPAYMTFAVIPVAAPLEWDGRTLTFQLANLNVGLLYILSISSLGVYGIIMASWSSRNKYALLGGLRSTSQMISYELSMGLSIIGIVLSFSSVELGTITAAQGQTWFTLFGVEIPKWGILFQPVGFLIFLTAVYAETNRLPFDLPEGESEIIAGYHLEFGAMRFALFMMAEYLNMFTGAALVVTLYLGGWQVPGYSWLHPQLVDLLGASGIGIQLLGTGLQFLAFVLKVAFFMWLFVWVRWTLPRFRYDQVMDLGWRIMFPLALLNVFFTGFMAYRGWV